MAAIPPLRPLGTVNCGEGPTDPRLFLKPEGTVKAVMVFVDFPDARGTDDPLLVARHLLGGGKAQQLFADQSGGRMRLDVTLRSELGWTMLDQASSSYGALRDGLVFFDTHAQHRKYIGDAAAKLRDRVDFTRFPIVLVVPPEAAALANSPAFHSHRTQGAPVPGGEIRHAVTFGKDSYTNSFINLVHEAGHLFGLPDLYPGGKFAEDSSAGCWGIMSDIFRSRGFLGWHRHKSGWLDAARKEYVSTPGVHRFTLTPLSEGAGVSMVVLPIDNPAQPSKVFVVEVAQPAFAKGSDEQSPFRGVLLYTVDASVESGKSPIEVLPHRPGPDPTRKFGNLFQAPFGVGASSGPRTVAGATAAVTLRVLSQAGSAFNVELTYAR